MEKGKDNQSNKLSTFDGWAIGSGAMVGVTIFVVSGTISGMAGPAASLGFIIAAVLVIAVALCYCEVSAKFPESGGAYLFPKRVLGEEKGKILSFISGWCLWGGQGIAPAVVTVATVGYLNMLLQLLGISIVLPTIPTAVVLTLLYFIANWYGSTGGKAVQNISTVAVVSILIIFIVWGGTNVNTETLTPFMPHGFSPILAAGAMCILSFSGWSTIPNMSGDFKNPVKDVPKSIIMSITTCAILFTLFVYVMNGLLPGAELAKSSAPPVSAMNTFTSVGALVITLGGLAACVSTSNGLLMTGFRIPYAMGKDGDMPSALAKKNKSDVPYNALILTALGHLLLIFSGSMINTLVSLTVCVTSVSWVISVSMSLIMRKKNIESPFKTPGFPITQIIAIVGLLFMFVRLTRIGIIMSIIWIILGFALYYIFKMKKKENKAVQ